MKLLGFYGSIDISGIVRFKRKQAGGTKVHVSINFVTPGGAIGESLEISQGAVQKHVSTIFNKLGVPASENDDRRILAVLTYLERLVGTEQR